MQASKQENVSNGIMALAMVTKTKNELCLKILLLLFITYCVYIYNILLRSIKIMQIFKVL